MAEKTLLEYSFLIFVIGAIISLLFGFKFKKASIYASAMFSILASSLSLYASAHSLINRANFNFSYNLGFPIGNFEILIDPLSSFFILLISLLSIPVSIYSIGYLKGEYLEKNIGLITFLYQLFILSMILVVSSSNGFQFLILWESMTLISFGFVIFEYKNKENQDAGFIYLLMTHIGAIFLLFTFLILAKFTGSFSFSSYFGIGNSIPLWLKNLLFIFIIIGFGTKAGIIPLHIWLPKAHPAAPSHISALMSGVMIKTGIYGIIRFTYDILYPFPHWWGLALGFIAIGTATLGIIFAISESDIKSNLAYSSIENIGVILLSLAASILFTSYNYIDFAALSLVASLLHTLNHSLFKGLLFLSSGAVISKTHTKNMEKLGGLIKLMPLTGFFFLIGALSISAFPPFNGFISEWLTFQSLLSLFQLKSDTIKLMAPIAAALLGFTGAVCAANFVKVFSGVFLGMPKSHQVSHIKEAPLSMTLGMGLLATACLSIGIFPGYVCNLLKNVTVYIFGYNIHSLVSLSKTGNSNLASNIPIVLFILLILLIFVILASIKIFGSKMPIRSDETWSCGISPKPEYGHTPKAYTQPLNVIFAELHVPESFYHKFIFLPIVNLLITLSHKIKPIQSGNIQLYLFYIFLALIISLIGVRL